MLEGHQHLRDFLAGRVEQDIVKPGEEVLFSLKQTPRPVAHRIFSLWKTLACPGDNVSLNIKGLNKNNMSPS